MRQKAPTVLVIVSLFAVLSFFIFQQTSLSSSSEYHKTGTNTVQTARERTQNTLTDESPETASPAQNTSPLTAGTGHTIPMLSEKPSKEEIDSYLYQQKLERAAAEGRLNEFLQSEEDRAQKQAVKKQKAADIREAARQQREERMRIRQELQELRESTGRHISMNEFLDSRKQAD